MYAARDVITMSPRPSIDAGLHFLREDMIGRLIKSQIKKNRDLILNEAQQMNGFIRLLMKQRNTGTRWTQSEKVQLRRYILWLARLVPVLCIVLLPGGSLLIPVMAEVIDRRERSRSSIEGPLS
jgi:hypothetical protein